MRSDIFAERTDGSAQRTVVFPMRSDEFAERTDESARLTASIVEFVTSTDVF
ncbi:hypothetical protein [Chryseobacterium sp. CFBP8996]|uniref:hypothetical protein n=1 Tax=Chryseobacterium sp. CFBP8996 TaxID=3096529 RepID=UPI002A6B3B24|nr:hypothetical protein [Chryseobacterium sp. CFBP8996]MDY0930500.1 hypothetical protein [Chryseobacterium sp. CFBP8996]